MKSTLLIIAVVAVSGSTLVAKPPPEKPISHLEAKKLVIKSPRPEYPPEARQMKITGSGVVLLRVDAAGDVMSATIDQSTGSPILDRAALSGYRRWRFRPGKAFIARMPIAFTAAGFNY